MNCDQLREWLPHYIDGLMTEGRADVIRLHIESCPGCAQALKEARELAALWKEMEEDGYGLDVAESPDLTAAVMAEIGKFEANRRQRSTAPATSRRRFAPRRTSWVHYSLAACLTFLLFQFGVFEGLGYQISEINGHMSSSVTSWFGLQTHNTVNK